MPAVLSRLLVAPRHRAGALRLNFPGVLIGVGYENVTYFRELTSRALGSLALGGSLASRHRGLALGLARPRVRESDPPPPQSSGRATATMIVGKRQIAKEEDTGSKLRRVSALSMYSTPPEEQLSLTEFEEFAFDRLRCTPRATTLTLRRSRMPSRPPPLPTLAAFARSLSFSFL